MCLLVTLLVWAMVVPVVSEQLFLASSGDLLSLEILRANLIKYFFVSLIKRAQ